MLLAGREVDLRRPQLVGILNVTPAALDVN